MSKTTVEKRDDTVEKRRILYRLRMKRVPNGILMSLEGDELVNYFKSFMGGSWKTSEKWMDEEGNPVRYKVIRGDGLHKPLFESFTFQNPDGSLYDGHKFSMAWVGAANMKCVVPGVYTEGELDEYKTQFVQVINGLLTKLCSKYDSVVEVYSSNKAA